jgi:hypothetical protein
MNLSKLLVSIYIAISMCTPAYTLDLSLKKNKKVLLTFASGILIAECLFIKYARCACASLEKQSKNVFSKWDPLSDSYYNVRFNAPSITSLFERYKTVSSIYQDNANISAEDRLKFEEQVLTSHRLNPAHNTPSYSWVNKRSEVHEDNRERFKVLIDKLVIAIKQTPSAHQKLCEEDVKYSALL